MCFPPYRSASAGVEWVLIMPPRLRYLLAWDHALCRAVVTIYLRAVLGWLRRQSRLRGVADGRGGAVAIIQRFGAALNLNVHIHALVLNGVFAPDASGGVSFRAHDRQDDDVGSLLVTIQRRIEALLNRRGEPDGRDGSDAPDRWRCGPRAPRPCRLRPTTIARRETTTEIGPPIGEQGRRCVERLREAMKRPGRR